METINPSKFPSMITKSPSMLSSRRVSSKTNKAKKTRNDNLKSKLQKSLNSFIKNHQTTIILSGSKRFSDKSGVYYLKNKISNGDVDNSLTPIPIMNNKKINSRYEKNSLSKAERTAVYLRRMEYASGISNSKMIEKKNKERNKKIIYIQQWWRMMFKLIFIQKNIKGFLFRKKLYEQLEKQAMIMNHLWKIKCSIEKSIMKKSFGRFKSLLIQDILLFNFIRKRTNRIKEKLLKKRFFYWKEYKLRIKVNTMIKKVYKYIMKKMINKVKRTNKYIYKPVTARKSRRQFSCELIQSNTVTIVNNESTNPTIKPSESTKKLLTEKKKAPIINRMSFATSNISMNTSFEELIEKKAEKIVVSKRNYQTNKKNKTTTIYTNQISNKKNDNQLITFSSCKKSLHFNQMSFNNLQIITNLYDKQKARKKYKKCLIKKYYTIWKNNKRVIKKQNSAIIYYSKKNLLRKTAINKRKNKSKNILLYFSFIEWKKNKVPILNINLLSIIHNLIHYQKSKLKAFRNQKLQYCLQIISNNILRHTLSIWRKVEPIRVFKKKNVFMKTKSAIEFPNLDLMNDSSVSITLPRKGIYSSKKINSFHISQSSMNPNISCNTIDLTSIEDRPSLVYSKTNPKALINSPNAPLYKKKILNVNYNFTNSNNYTTIDYDNEDRENYMNNTFTVDSRYNAMNTNTTSTNITCHDTSSFYLKDVPTIKTKIIRFKKKY